MQREENKNLTNLIPANRQGLEDAIGVSVVHPTWQRTKPGTEDEHTGWAFADPKDPPFTSSTGHGSFPPIDCIPDPNVGATFVRYAAAVVPA